MWAKSIFLSPRPRYLKPRSRYLKNLDRGFLNPSTEGLTNPRSRDLQTLGQGLKKIDLAHIQTNEKFPVPCRGVNPTIPST